MAKNVTLMGASYSDVPAVNLPQTGGGTARFTDTSGTTATASDVAQGKVFYAADGTETTGTASGGGGGVDIPVFTITWDDNGENVLSVTCNKTFAECWTLSDAGNSAAMLISTDQSHTGEWPTSIQLTQLGGPSDPLLYTAYGENGAVDDVRYDPDGTLTYIYPSSMSEVLNVTANGTYYPNRKTISEVNVNVPTGGGDSAWTKIAETEVTVSTTGTSTATVTTWATGQSGLIDAESWLYVRVRDTAGKRAGYFYGSDQFFYCNTPPSSTGGISTALRISTRFNNSNTFVTTATTSSTGYGVYADYVYQNGNVRIRSRYNSSYSLTIDGTYKVELYSLNTPDGVPIFE